MDLRELWERLKRRKLATWTAAYVTTAAALFGTLETIGDVFAWPAGIMRAVFFLLAAGLVVTVMLAWFHGERGRQRIKAGEAALLGAVALLGIGGATSSLLDSRATADPRSTLPSLVVRPFTNASTAADQAYLGFGIAEEIRRALSSREGLPVARASDMSPPGAHVLEGSVARAGQVIRIAARLTDDAGVEVWSQRFEAPFDELFDVEGQIVDAVAARAGTSGDRALLPRAVDPLAHDAYLRGEHALGLRTPASVIQAIGQYRAASAASPGFAAAMAREAYAYGLFLDWGWTYPGLDHDELLRRGLALSERALAVDSLSPEGWLAKAYLAQLADPLHPSRAIPAYERAAELDPANPEAQHQYGQTLMSLGRYAEAKAAYHAALAIDADRPMTLVPLSAIAHREGDLAAARRWADSAVVLAPDAPYPWASRGMLRVKLGESEGAGEDAERALAIDPSFEVPARSTLASALWVSGDRARAEEELNRAQRAMVHPEQPAPTEVYYLGAALLHLGRPGEALDLIEAARPRSPWLWFYLASPDFDEVRDAPRFRAVIDASYPDHPRAGRRRISRRTER